MPRRTPFKTERKVIKAANDTQYVDQAIRVLKADMISLDFIRKAAEGEPRGASPVIDQEPSVVERDELDNYLKETQDLRNIAAHRLQFTTIYGCVSHDMPS